MIQTCVCLKFAHKWTSRSQAIHLLICVIFIVYVYLQTHYWPTFRHRQRDALDQHTIPSLKPNISIKTEALSGDHWHPCSVWQTPRLTAQQAWRWPWCNYWHTDLCWATLAFFLKAPEVRYWLYFVLLSRQDNEDGCSPILRKLSCIDVNRELKERY